MRTSNILIAVLLGCLSAASTAAAGDIAIVVNRENAISDLSFTELVKIFRQDRQYWDGQKIYLIMREAGSPERDVILRRVYRMQEGEALKKYWIGKLYRGEISTFPKTLSSNEAVKRFVSQASSAIGFVDASTVDEHVKVLRIDGKLPGEGGYALPSS